MTTRNMKWGNFTKIRGKAHFMSTPHFMDTPTLNGFYKSDTVNSVADQGWKNGGVHTINIFGPRTYLQSAIFRITHTNDLGSSLVCIRLECPAGHLLPQRRKTGWKHSSLKGNGCLSILQSGFTRLASVCACMCIHDNC